MKSFLKFFAIAALFATIAVSDTTSFTIFVVGDSTVQTYAGSAYPQTGWGQVLENFFDASRVKVANHALGGRSSKLFIEEKRLDAVVALMQKGDYLFIQWGHNDRDYSKEARYVPFDQFSGYVQQYVDAAFSKGANPVLISPMNLNGSRNIFSTGDKNYNARGAMEDLAKKNKIPFVDLNMKSYNMYNVTYKAIPDYVTRYLYKKLEAGEYPNYPDGVNDGTTHFQEMGSMGHGVMIVEELEANLKNNTNLSADAKSALTQLVSAIKPRYTIKVKTNLSNYNGLITQTQYFPAGSPLTLRVTPNGQTFQKWVDDDCNDVSSQKIAYGIKTKARDITYTAMFAGGAACTPTAHGNEDASGSGNQPSSSSSVASSSSGTIDPGLCLESKDSQWPSLIEMYQPEIFDGFNESQHAGYTGNGYFNIENSAYSKATYNLTSEQSAEHGRVMIRYAFSGTTNRDMKFTIDSGVYDVVFKPTGGWDKWDTTYIDEVWLDALDFKMTIQSTTSDGGPNIDVIAFDLAGVYRTGCKVEESPASSSSSENAQPGSSSNVGSSDSQTIRTKNDSRGMRLNQGRSVNLLGRSVPEKNRARGVYFKAK